MKLFSIGAHGCDVFYAASTLSFLNIALVFNTQKREDCLRDCGISAQCEYSEAYNDHVCVCKNGFEGNHIKEVRENLIQSLR